MKSMSISIFSISLTIADVSEPPRDDPKIDPPMSEMSSTTADVNFIGASS
eukprot:CAMPEP_0179705632 /NCGR_PEP_ID=MMETSP0937-20121108/3930_1 /TAXON_ID=548131 ORGANISM="Ostreococcus mediterraneus, Strain clade-D-RCC2593" /NCGR_SAMPLE_ID=MMETSP0937 /ASSEMBLY_ACC=CAM_ASM_000575 /LENGTH=49 /DNA_ID= /DNA_START= /DNA_END= /DNA_ORIENTATION=